MTDNRTSGATEQSTPREELSRADPSWRPRADSIAAHQLAVAVTWLDRGVPVIPCSRTDKAPMVAGFGKDATAEQLAPFSDRQQVHTWWQGRFRRAHVGILTRTLVVVDLDMPKEGTEAPTGRWDGCRTGLDVFERLVQDAEAEWPETYTVMTPSGGMHLYFQQPAGDPIGCATGEGPTAPHLGPLVDVRGVGGLVIAAGSYSSKQGSSYRRITPSVLRPQPLPGWLLDLLRPAPAPTASTRPARLRPTITLSTREERYAAAALDGAARDVASAGTGERNDRLFSRARHLGQLSSTAPRVLTEDAVREQLLAAARECGLDGGDRAALATIRSGWGKGLRDGSLGGAA